MASRDDATCQLPELLARYPHFGPALRRCASRLAQLPAERRQGWRLCHELQQTHWFYIDELASTAGIQLPTFRQTQFFELVLLFSEEFRLIYESPESRQLLLAEWHRYLATVPRRGAVIFDEMFERCLMVQSFGGMWSHPCGKLEDGENETDCAAREVLEEVGLDVSSRIDDSQYVKATIKDEEGLAASVKLFLIAGIPGGVVPRPRVRKEVSKIAWVQVRKLPGWTQDDDSTTKLRFFNVACFVPKLKRWIAKTQGQAAGQLGRLEPRSKIAEGKNKSEGKRPPVAADALDWLDIPRMMEAFDQSWMVAARTLQEQNRTHSSWIS